jgi:hypothetical protein
MPQSSLMVDRRRVRRGDVYRESTIEIGSPPHGDEADAE